MNLMKKLAFMSDLHIDGNNFGDLEIETLRQVLRDHQVGHLHLAGDLSNQLYQISLPFLEELKESFSISYNLGNHDMLGLSESDIQAHGPQIHTWHQHSFLAQAGWYDYSFSPHYSLEENQRNKATYWFDRKLKRQGSDPEICQKELDLMAKTLETNKEIRTVALHFVPHQDFLINHPFFHRFNGFLGSQSFHQLFLDYGVKNVVFGHLHRRYHATTIDGVTYHTRPLGYKREWKMVTHFFHQYPQFQDLDTYRISKRYNSIKDLPEFQAFYQKHLYQEFTDALILLD